MTRDLCVNWFVRRVYIDVYLCGEYAAYIGKLFDYENMLSENTIRLEHSPPENIYIFSPSSHFRTSFVPEMFLLFLDQ